jgi:PIN domain nuclease of toxin-antitoxin system
MPRPILLDTCALLWISNKSPIASSATDALLDSEEQPGGLVVSPISAWEIGQLASKGRLALPMDPLSWFRAALEVGLELAPMPADVLIGSSFLPSPLLRDPADRIIAATARAYGYRLMTRDRPLLEFAAKGHLQAIAC